MTLHVRIISQRTVVDVNTSIEDLYGVAFKSNHPIDHQLCWVERMGQQCHIASPWTRVSIFERTDERRVTEARAAVFAIARHASAHRRQCASGPACCLA